MKNVWFLFVSAALMLLLGLGGVVVAQPGGNLSTDALIVAQDNNGFALDLFGQLRAGEGNAFYSPYSISSALAMTYAGARGETAAAMAKTLHFTLPPDRFDPAFGELVHLLNAKGEKRPYYLNVANALWGQKGYNFLPSFLKVAQDQYEAGLKDLDFAKETEQARQIINKWVEDQTQDKIKELLTRGTVTPATRLILTNAIYFKAPWQNRFFDKSTKDADFYLADGGKSKVAMMFKIERTQYMEDEDFQAVSLPYQDHALSMMVLLPKKADGLAGLEKSLTAERLQQWSKKMEMYEVNLKLPKFKLTSEFKLSKTLSKLGMGIAFSNRADFSGMTSQEGLTISEVIHKAFVSVDEKGTEAAAATAVIISMKTSAPPQNVRRATFHANRPFVFLIRENRTGSILFMGRIVNANS